jgi:hypothetical protein
VFGIRRSEFDISEERMFWETHPDAPSGNCTATTAPAPDAGGEQPVAASMLEAAEAPPSDEEAEAVPLRPASPSAVGVGERDPVHHDLPLPSWAIEPDWAVAPSPSPTPRRRTRLRLAAGAAAVCAAILFVFGALALGGHSARVMRRPMRTAAAHARQAGRPVVLASFQVNRARSPRTTHVVARRTHRAQARPKSTRGRKRHSRSGSPTPVTRAPMTFLPAPVPQRVQPAQASPAPRFMPPPVASSSPAPPAHAAPRPRPSPGSEFGFER